MREEESGKKWEESYRRHSWEKINAEVPRENKRKKERGKQSAVRVRTEGKTKQG